MAGASTGYLPCNIADIYLDPFSGVSVNTEIHRNTPSSTEIYRNTLQDIYPTEIHRQLNSYGVSGCSVRFMRCF